MFFRRQWSFAETRRLQLTMKLSGLAQDEEVRTSDILVLTQNTYTTITLTSATVLTMTARAIARSVVTMN